MTSEASDVIVRNKYRHINSLRENGSYTSPKAVANEDTRIVAHYVFLGEKTGKHFFGHRMFLKESETFLCHSQNMLRARQTGK